MQRNSLIFRIMVRPSCPAHLEITTVEHYPMRIFGEFVALCPPQVVAAHGDGAAMACDNLRAHGADTVLLLTVFHPRAVPQLVDHLNDLGEGG